MKLIGFIFFLMVTVSYVWSGKNTYNKKEWWGFFVKFIGVFIVMILSTFFLKYLHSIWDFAPVATIKLSILKFFTSCLFVLGAKLGVVGLCTIFSNLLIFHKKYNPRYYPTLSSISENTSPGLIVFTKCIVSLSSLLAFYGIWLA